MIINIKELIILLLSKNNFMWTTFCNELDDKKKFDIFEAKNM
jgi:hypothetical protein